MSRFATICCFSSFNFRTIVIKSSKCFCFLILDLLADSRFEIILFRFLCSINAANSPSSIDEQVEDVTQDDAIKTPPKQSKNRAKKQSKTERKNRAKQSKLLTTISSFVIWICGFCFLDWKSWNVVEPVEKNNGEGLNKVMAAECGVYNHTSRTQSFFTEN